MRRVLLVGGTLVLVAAVGAGAQKTREYGSVGALAAELRGSTETSHFDRAADAPAAVVPAWLRSTGRDVTVKQPGSSAGDVQGVKVDAPAKGVTLPANCERTTSRVIPWDGGGHWPDARQDALRTCDGWLVFVADGRVYAWR